MTTAETLTAAWHASGAPNPTAADLAQAGCHLQAAACRLALLTNGEVRAEYHADAHVEVDALNTSVSRALGAIGVHLVAPLFDVDTRVPDAWVVLADVATWLGEWGWGRP